ncbi:MAG: OmpA family protein [Bacteroidota bacterium]|nr:OmpA family protein [Bacteroidota bacterium]
MQRFLPYSFLIAAIMFTVSCTSIYESGSDMSADWLLRPVDAANGAADEVAPVPTQGGLYFTSNREVDGDDRDRLYFLAAGAGKADMLRGSSGEVKRGALLCFPDGDARVLFTECYREDAVGDCDLVEGRIGSDPTVISDVRLLPEGLNDVEWDHHPAMSGDGGAGSVLVFASERFGGEGGSDLWMSLRGAKGWGTPSKLGSAINTGGNEISPWLSPDGRELYFSSDAHPGRGGFDIYRARLPEGSTPASGAWTAPEPLGAPVNSDEDDLFFAGSLAADTVYFSSNRDGGAGGFDIYRCVRRSSIRKDPPPPPPAEKEKPLVLRVRAVNAYTLESVNAVISVTPAGSDLMLAEGTDAVELPLDVDSRYDITAMRAGYLDAVEEYYAGGDAAVMRKARDEGERMVIEHSVVLTPVAEEERKIYSFTVEFDFNLSNIRPEEEKKLDSAAVLLGKYPQSTVVVSGHTDSVGTVAYNIKLGYRRAREVSAYVQTWLERRNVRLLNDMEIRTFGESEPLAPNRTEEGRQRNRRVEIAIVRNR